MIDLTRGSNAWFLLAKQTQAECKRSVSANARAGARFHFPHTDHATLIIAFRCLVKQPTNKDKQLSPLNLSGKERKRKDYLLIFKIREKFCPGLS